MLRELGQAAPERHGQQYTTYASGNAQVNIAGRDQHIGDRYDLDLNPASAFFTGRGPGRLLMVIGLCVIVFGSAGWASIVFGGFGGSGRPSGPSAMLGKSLGSGIPVGVVYFLSFGFGGVLPAIGQSMAKAAARRQDGLLGHFLTTAVVVGAGLLALVYALGGSDRNQDLSADARQTGTMKLTKPVRLGTGKLRVEFTTVMGLTGPDAIAVSGVPSR